MIGGAMLACAVGAMILIAWWSLPRDDEDDPATGLLALRTWSEGGVVRAHNAPRNHRDRRPRVASGDVKVKANGKRDRRPDPSTKRRRRS